MGRAHVNKPLAWPTSTLAKYDRTTKKKKNCEKVNHWGSIIPGSMGEMKSLWTAKLALCCFKKQKMEKNKNRELPKNAKDIRFKNSLRVFCAMNQYFNSLEFCVCFLFVLLCWFILFASVYVLCKWNLSVYVFKFAVSIFMYTTGDVDTIVKFKTATFFASTCVLCVFFLFFSDNVELCSPLYVMLSFCPV